MLLGSDSGSPVRHNAIEKLVNISTAHLFAPERIRFGVILPPHYGDQWIEEEDGARASFRTLLFTLSVAACISVVVSRAFVIQHMLRYPETVGLVMAGLLLLGRYTGYRLTELYRFRDFVRDPLPEPARVVTGRGSFGSGRF